MLKKDTRSGYRVARVSLYSELKKRKVFTTAAIYIPVAWLAAEIFIFLSDRLGAPHWVGDIIAVQFILGFPVCLVLAWLFDVSRDGIKRASPGTPMGIVALLASGLFLVGGAYVSHKVFTGRLSEISVAVLPLNTNATVPEAEPYGFGVADSLRSALQRVPVFRVPARTSSEAVVRAGRDIPAIASQLDVQYIVEGTLEMVGQRLNVSISLIDSDGTVQWSERFERATRDLFELQNDLVRAVALKLGLDESNDALQKSIRKPAPTQDMQAHHLYLQGKYADLVPGRSMVQSAGMKALKEARQLDPGYAAVHSAMAFLYGFDCWMGENHRSSECELAVNHATQALEIDPDQADALNTLALVHSLRYEFHEAQNAIDQFLALDNPILNSSSLPWAYMNLGRLQLAWDSAREYYRNDPLNIFSVGNVVLWSSVLKKDDAMAEHYEEILIELLGFSILGGYPATRAHRVDMQTATEDLQNLLPVWGVSPEVAPTIANIWVRPIYEPSFRQYALDDLEGLSERGDIPSHTFWEGLILLHQTDRAINMAFDSFDQGTLNPVIFWLNLPGGKELRSHPRFIELIEHMGLASFWDEVGWPPFCELRGNGRFCGLDFAVE